MAGERRRQDSLVAAGSIPWNLAEAGPAAEAKLAVVTEEFLEVCREVLAPRSSEGHLYVELTQLAAVAVAWLEALGPRCEARRPGAKCELKEGHPGPHSAFQGVVGW